MTLRDILNILFKRRWTLVLGFLLFAGALVAMAHYWPRTYSSVATLYLQSKHESMDQSLAENPTISRTTGLLLEDVLSEVQLLGSEPIRQRVIDELGLEGTPIGKGERASRRAWNSYIRENLDVEAAANAHIISLTFTDGDPERAARIVSTYADCYLRFRRGITRDEGGTDDVRAELEQSRAELTRLEELLIEFDQRWNLVAADEQKRRSLELQADARSRVSAIKGELQGLDHEVQVYRTTLAADAPELLQIDVVRASATIELFEGQLAALELERTTLLSSSTEEHKPVQRVERKIEDVRRALRDKGREIVRSFLFTKETEAEAKRAELAVHQELIEQVEEEMAVLSEKAALRERMAMDRELSSDHVKMVTRRLGQLLVDNSLDDTGNIAVVVASYGSVPEKPAFPPPMPLVVVASVLLGLLLSFGAVVVLDLMDDTFVTPEDVEEHLGVPVLASVPRKRRHRLSRFVGGG